MANNRCMFLYIIISVIALGALLAAWIWFGQTDFGDFIFTVAGALFWLSLPIIIGYSLLAP